MCMSAPKVSAPPPVVVPPPPPPPPPPAATAQSVDTAAPQQASTPQRNARQRFSSLRTDAVATGMTQDATGLNIPQ